MNTASSCALKVKAAVLCAAHGRKWPTSRRTAAMRSQKRCSVMLSFQESVFNPYSLASHDAGKSNRANARLSRRVPCCPRLNRRKTTNEFAG